MATPKITKIEVEGFDWTLKGLGHGRAYHWDPDSSFTRGYSAVRIHADNGVIGEYAGGHGNPVALAEYAESYIGTNALDREFHYQRGKSSSEMAKFDLALWDLAGKTAGMPVHAMLGTYRRTVPCYASSVDGAATGPLSTPESYGDFAEECREIGYPAFKIHPFAWRDVKDHQKAVLAISDAVGDDMDMMLDSYCLYETFADALKVGRACDEAGFYWYEDPYSDGGVTNFSHQRLRERLDTLLLQGEKVQTVEQRMDMILQGATDLIRGDVAMQGLTGTMKLAHAAESVGIDIEPHGSGPAQLHFMAATKNANYYEVVWVHPNMPSFNPPIHKNMNVDTLRCVDENGMLTVTDDPGFGVEYDWDFIGKHSTGKVVVE